MKVKLSLLLLVVALMAVAAYAQTGVAGKWVGELAAADGHGVAQPISVDLKVEGDAVSGTVTEGALESRPITAASVQGTTLSFRTTRNLGGSDINVNWKGELKGEDLTLTREIGPAPAEAGGRGGRGGGAAPAAGGRGGRGGGAAPAAGGQRGAAPAAPVPPVPAPDAGQAPDAAAPAAAGRGGGARGGGRGDGAAPPAAGAAPAAGGRGAAAPAPGPTVTLTLRRSR